MHGVRPVGVCAVTATAAAVITMRSLQNIFVVGRDGCRWGGGEVDVQIWCGLYRVDCSALRNVRNRATGRSHTNTYPHIGHDPPVGPFKYLHQNGRNAAQTMYMGSSWYSYYNHGACYMFRCEESKIWKRPSVMQGDECRVERTFNWQTRSNVSAILAIFLHTCSTNASINYALPRPTL